jgi:MauM/NapG family ferredoxin protein
LQRRLDPATCNHCDLCGLKCHGAASAAAGESWKASECFGCLNCTSACRKESLRWTFAVPVLAGIPAKAGTTSVQAPSRSRRRFLRDASRVAGTLAGATAAMALFRAAPQARGATGNQSLIRPPGALPERNFLARCTACGACMKICPTGCLQPAWDQAGLEGLWTPVVNPRLGRCEYDCTLCGHVCPTGAIARLTVEQKHATKIGIAMLDHSRCIPYAYGRDCGTCVEACPFPEKAIRMVDVEVQINDGKTQSSRWVSQPMVDPDRCTGCGGCVTVCIFRDEPAIHVVSANETRNEAAQPFLDFKQKPAKQDAPAGDAPAGGDPYGS